MASETLIATGDITLIARVQTAAADSDVPLGYCLQELIGRFNAVASPEDWMAVMNAASRSDTPGAACLRVMLKLAIANQQSVGDTPL